jgi:hypothetical protein
MRSVSSACVCVEGVNTFFITCIVPILLLRSCPCPRHHHHPRPHPSDDLALVIGVATPVGVPIRWKADGLPSDSLSMQNAIVLLNFTQKVPFIIDPATSATSWLQHHLSKVPWRLPAHTLRRRTHTLLGFLVLLPYGRIPFSLCLFF